VAGVIDAHGERNRQEGPEGDLVHNVEGALVKEVDPFHQLA
jgi:hypothetical protein